MRIKTSNSIGTVYKPEIVSAYFVECGLPKPVFEYAHIPFRRFLLDVAWPADRVGIEIQGGLWIVSAHSTGKGIKRDMEKRNLALINGWRVLEVEPKELCMADTVCMVKVLMGTAAGCANAEPEPRRACEP